MRTGGHRAEARHLEEEVLGDAGHLGVAEPGHSAAPVLQPADAVDAEVVSLLVGAHLDAHRDLVSFVDLQDRREGVVLLGAQRRRGIHRIGAIRPAGSVLGRSLARSAGVCRIGVQPVVGARHRAEGVGEVSRLRVHDAVTIGVDVEGLRVVRGIAYPQGQRLVAHVDHEGAGIGGRDSLGRTPGPGAGARAGELTAARRLARRRIGISGLFRLQHVRQPHLVAVGGVDGLVGPVEVDRAATGAIPLVAAIGDLEVGELEVELAVGVPVGGVDVRPLVGPPSSRPP